MLIFKFHFSFLWMDVNIYFLRIKFQKKEKGWHISRLKQAFKSFLYCFIEVCTSEVSSINKKELLASCFLGPFRLSNKTMKFTPVNVFFNRNQTRLKLSSENIHNTLHLASFSQSENSFIIMKKGRLQILMS